MAYVLALVLVAVGLALILARGWVGRDMARSPWYHWPGMDLSDPAVQRLYSLGPVVFGLLFIGVGLYIAGLAARIAP